ncbi:helix-turn-helix domain-containing protein [Thermosediminibacter oceani]|uniref:Helix-turn-helix domain protein n=1 Tax=Thermosediminibacter oceani (strain ATCC BAA-1034 / DSM 16646 / JW/IW-1228P) TaxID=555079 RepID=D9RYG7_THEOJ|nr:helix-turn-helix transcriptional regulator [Thermosediminibacter oceani]ADL08391.1 helix-turn-helix domain protein [Thermosediminibacter oceani DSM 16646]
MENGEFFKNIGKRIRQIRLQRDLTQEELGERANLHYSYIGQVERGDKLPSLKTLSKIAKALNVSLDYVLEDPATYEAQPDTEAAINELVTMVRTRPVQQIKLLISVCRTILEELDSWERAT